MRTILAFVAGISLATGLSTPSFATDDAAHTLSVARKAYGSVNWKGLGVLVQTGTENAAGLTGTFRMAQDLGTGHMHATSDFGVFQSAEVWDGENHWRQDHSGGVHALNSAFSHANAATDMWLARLGFLKPNSESAHIQFLGTETADGRSFDKLRATPLNGQPVELWFDRQNGLLARSVWEMPISIKTVRYDNYRLVHGIMLPFKITEDENDENPDTTVVTHAEFMKQPIPGEFAPPKAPDDSTIAGGTATVPITFDHDIIVDAMINGKGPFSFILDTGGHDILTPDAAKALGLTGLGASQSGGAGEGTLTEQYTRLDELSIGGVTLRHQAFFIIPLQYDTVERGSKPPLAGILGLELFERFAMELNYRAQTITFRPLTAVPHRHGVAVPITFTDDAPLFEGKIDGIAGNIQLDTGNSGTLVVQGRWADEQGLTDRLTHDGVKSVGLGSGGMSQNLSSYADFEAGGVKFPHIPATYENDMKGAFSSRTEAGNAGNSIYANFTLSFDYGRNTVWFDPEPGYEIPSSERAGLGVYKETADAFIVAVVDPHSPSDQAGLAVNDKIVTINGIPSSQFSGWDFGRLKRQKPGTKITLEFLRGSERHQALITLRDL